MTTLGHPLRTNSPTIDDGPVRTDDTSADSGRAPSNRARIETLPSELLFYLSRFVDLAALVMLSTATSRGLRTVFGQFDRELLFLEPRHRFSLAEWRDAARQIDAYVLNPDVNQSSPGSEGLADKPSKRAEPLSRKLFELIRDDSLAELRFFESVLGFLNLSESRLPRIDSSVARVAAPVDSKASSRVNQIRCLHLTGWHGMGGVSLISQMRLQPALSEVTTIVKTERGDTRIWKQAAADDQRYRRMSRTGQISMASLRPGAASHRETGAMALCFGAASNEPLPMEFKHCTSTQIIVQVGRRRPRQHGQAYLRGEGLQMGYQGYCIAILMDSDLHEDLEKGSANVIESHGYIDGDGNVERKSEPGAEPEDNLRSQNESRRRLHVILTEREEVGADAEERKQNEDMFERSLVTCNHCKERIVF